jgi:arylsulfatase A-like enzyme
MKTPALQKLHDGGLFLSHMHTWKACAPSRGSIMSGRYPFHFGFYKNQDANAYGLPTNFSTLPELLSSAGYATHMVGKCEWAIVSALLNLTTIGIPGHLGFRSEALTPTRRGFDTYLGYYEHGEDYYTHVFNTECGRAGVDFNNATSSNHPNVWPLDGFNGTYSAFIFAAEAQRLIRNHASSKTTKPMYLYVAMQNVHAPIEVPERFESLYDGVITDSKRKTFAGMVSALDEAVENITSTLAEVGMWEDTLFLFNSDNGGPLGSANNYPLRGGKFTYWDGGLRIQAFVHSPRLDIIPQSMVGQTWSGLAHTVDIMPTFLAAAGVAFDPASTYHGPVVPPIPFDGLNLLTAMQTNGSSPRTEVVHMIDNEYNQAVCNQSTGSLKGQLHCGAGIRVGDFKLIIGYPGEDIWEKPPALPSAASALDASPVCSTGSFLNNSCMHVFNGQLANFSSPSAADCCAACSKNTSCGAFSYKNKRCFLKVLSAKQVPKAGNCISGIVRPHGPSPGPSPSPCDYTTGYGCPCNPPSRGCLFRISDDPNEHHDLANDTAFEADYQRLLARLREVSRSGVVAAEQMLGKTQVKADSGANCANVNDTGHFEPYATHVPYLPYPAAGWSKAD